MNTNVLYKDVPARMKTLGWLRQFNKRVTNRLTLRFAGKHVYAVIHHQGRKSGRADQTPVVAIPSGDSFLFPLPYGKYVDWYRNVLASGGCRMEWSGRYYPLHAPQLIEPQEALPAFPKWLYPLLRRTEIYLRLERLAGPELPVEQKMRRILVFGAGVVGSIYAGKLLEELTEQGLVLVDDAKGKLERIPVKITDQLAPEDAYDLVLVIVRKKPGLFQPAYAG